MAAGDFTASQLGDIIRFQNEFFKKSRVNNHLDQPVETAKTLMALQQVAFDPIMDSARNCVGQKLVWLKGSGDAVTEDSTATCTIDGAQFESASQMVTPNIKLDTKFSVLDNQCKDKIDTNTKIAYGMLDAKTRLLTALNNKFIAHIDSQLSDNTTPTTGTWDNTNKWVAVTPAAWTQDLIASLNLDAIKNKMYNPIILNGTNFFNAKFNAMYNTLNDNQRDQLAKFNHFNMYWDVRNIDAAVGEKATYVIDPGVIGFWNQTEYNTTTPYWNQDDKNTFTWKEAVPELQYNDNGTMRDIYVDVRMQRRCAANGNNLSFGYYFQVLLRAGLVAAPAPSATDKGILKYVNV